MNRWQLEHIIRASAAITGTDRIVIAGSQAILGEFPEAPAELLASMEADVFTFRDPHDAELIEGSIGEGSPFHQTFGYFAHGITEEVVILPDDWRDRLVPVQNENTAGGIGLCLELHDLLVSKLAAGREKDIDYIKSVLRHRLARRDLIEQRLGSTPINEERRAAYLARFKRIVEGP